MKSFDEMCADGRAGIIDATMSARELWTVRVRAAYRLTWWWCTEGRRRYGKAR